MSLESGEDASVMERIIHIRSLDDESQFATEQEAVEFWKRSFMDLSNDYQEIHSNKNDVDEDLAKLKERIPALEKENSDFVGKVKQLKEDCSQLMDESFKYRKRSEKSTTMKQIMEIEMVENIENLKISEMNISKLIETQKQTEDNLEKTRMDLSDVNRKLRETRKELSSSNELIEDQKKEIVRVTGLYEEKHRESIKYTPENYITKKKRAEYEEMERENWRLKDIERKCGDLREELRESQQRYETDLGRLNRVEMFDLLLNDTYSLFKEGKKNEKNGKITIDTKDVDEMIETIENEVFKEPEKNEEDDGIKIEDEFLLGSPVVASPVKKTDYPSPVENNNERQDEEVEDYDDSPIKNDHDDISSSSSSVETKEENKEPVDKWQALLDDSFSDNTPISPVDNSLFDDGDEKKKDDDDEYSIDSILGTDEKKEEKSEMDSLMDLSGFGMDDEKEEKKDDDESGKENEEESKNQEDKKEEEEESPKKSGEDEDDGVITMSIPDIKPLHTKMKPPMKKKKNPMKSGASRNLLAGWSPPPRKNKKGRGMMKNISIAEFAAMNRQRKEGKLTMGGGIASPKLRRSRSLVPPKLGDIGRSSTVSNMNNMRGGELQRVNNRLVRTERDLNKAKRELKNTKKENEELKKEVEETSKYIKDKVFQNLKVSSEEEYEEFVKMMESKKEKLDEMNEEMERIKVEISDERKSFQEEIQEKEDRFRLIEEELDSKNKTIQMMEKDMEVIRVHQTEPSGNVDEEDKISELKDYSLDFYKKLKNLNGYSSMLFKENQELWKLLYKFKNDKKPSDGGKKYQDEIKKFEKELIEKKKSKSSDESFDDLDDFDEENEDIDTLFLNRKQNKDIKNTNGLLSQISSLEERNNILESDLKDIKTKLVASKKETTILKKKEENNKAKERIKKLKIKIEDLELDKSDLTQQMELMTINRKEDKDKLAKFEKDNTKLTRESKQLKRKLKRAQRAATTNNNSPAPSDVVSETQSTSTTGGDSDSTNGEENRRLINLKNEHAVSDLKKENEKLKKKIRALTTKLKNSESQQQKSTTPVTSPSRSVERFKKKIKDLETNIKENEKKISIQNKKISDLLKSQKEFKKKEMKSNQDLSTLRKKLSTSEKKFFESQKKLKNIQSKKNNNPSTESTTTTTTGGGGEIPASPQQQKVIRKLKIDTRNLEKKNKQLETDLLGEKNRSKKYHQQFEKLKKKTSQSPLNSPNKKIGLNEKKKLEKELNSVRNQLKLIQKSNSNIKEKMISEKGKYKALFQENEKLKKSNSSSISQNHMQIKTLKKDKLIMSNNIKQLKQKISKLKEEQSKKKPEEQQNQQEQEQEEQERKKKYDELQSKFKQQEIKINKYRKKLKKMQVLLDSEKMRVNDLKKVSSIEDNNNSNQSEIEEKHEESLKKIKRLETKVKKFGQISSRYKTLKESHKNLQLKIEKQNEINTEISVIREKYAKLQRQLDSKKKENRTQNLVWEGQIRDYQKQIFEKEEYINRLRMMEKRMSPLKIENSKLRKRCKGLQSIKSKLNDSIEDLEKKKTKGIELAVETQKSLLLKKFKKKRKEEKEMFEKKKNSIEARLRDAELKYQQKDEELKIIQKEVNKFKKRFFTLEEKKKKQEINLLLTPPPSLKKKPVVVVVEGNHKNEKEVVKDDDDDDGEISPKRKQFLKELGEKRISRKNLEVENYEMNKQIKQLRKKYHLCLFELDEMMLKYTTTLREKKHFTKKFEGLRMKAANLEKIITGGRRSNNNNYNNRYLYSLKSRSDNGSTEKEEEEDIDDQGIQEILRRSEKRLKTELKDLMDDDDDDSNRFQTPTSKKKKKKRKNKDGDDEEDENLEFFSPSRILGMIQNVQTVCSNLSNVL